MASHVKKLLDSQHPFEYYNNNIQSIQTTLFRQNVICSQFTSLMIDAIGDTQLGQYATLLHERVFSQRKTSEQLLHATINELDNSSDFQHMYEQLKNDTIYPVFRKRNVFSPAICFAIAVHCILRMGCCQTEDGALQCQIKELGQAMAYDCFQALYNLMDLTKHWRYPDLIMIQEELNVWHDYKNFHRKGKVFTNRPAILAHPEEDK